MERAEPPAHPTRARAKRPRARFHSPFPGVAMSQREIGIAGDPMVEEEYQGGGDGAFFVNITARGENISGQIYRYYMRKTKGVDAPPADLVPKENLGFMHSMNRRAVEMAGSVMSTLSTNSTGKAFEWVAEDAARRAMGELLYRCRARTVFSVCGDESGNAVELFASVRISNLAFTRSQRGFCGTPCYCPIPVCFFHLCCCCPHAHFPTCCCACCRPPLNITAVADYVREIIERENKEPGGKPFEVDVEAEYAAEEFLYLEKRGFHAVDLGGGGME